MTTSGCDSHCWLPALYTSHPDASSGEHTGGSREGVFALPLAGAGASGGAGAGVSSPMTDDCMRTTACDFISAFESPDPCLNWYLLTVSLN
jgi:hypothetical protein